MDSLQTPFDSKHLLVCSTPRTPGSASPPPSYPPGFDAHFSSCGKEYHYLMGCGAPSPAHARQRWWVYDRWCEQSRGKPRGLGDVRLDVGAMQEAAQVLQVRAAALLSLAA